MPTPPRALVLAVLTGLLLTVLSAVRAPIASAQASVTREGTTLTVTNGLLSVRYDLERGLADYTWGARPVVRHGYSSAVLAGPPERTVYSFNAGRRTASESRFTDAIGSGLTVRVTTELADAGVALIQQLYVYDGEPFLTQRASVESLVPGEPVGTGQIEVIAAGSASTPAGGVDIGPAADPRFYQAPFYNNDDFAVIPRAAARAALSYWLGGVVDAAGGVGLVAGAVETTRWKSAVWYDGPSGAFSAHSGTRSPVDSLPAAPRAGRRVDSALTFLGYRERYGDALADLMRAVRAVEPPLPAPPLPAPIGWSAWYESGIATDEATVRGVTDFIAANWAGLGYRYINLDAGWNRADGDTRNDPVKFPSGMPALTSYIHERGLLAGAYFVPFAISPSLLDQTAPGSNFKYRDMLVRDGNGEPIRASILDWEYVLDTTHPGAWPLLYLSARRLADEGFDFVKLDFLHIGTQEGVRFNPAVTGIEAFHLGMQAVAQAFADSGRPMFLSAAISPLYLQQYVHARRVGNDVEFGQARQAKNVALSWFTGLLYARNDPDNAVVRESWFPGYNERLAKLHVTMSALGGTLFLAGDDPRGLTPRRAALLTNPDVLALAKQPLVARPLGVQGEPPSIWYAAEPGGSRVVAVFNWNGAASTRTTVRVRDLGLDEGAVYAAYDLWNQGPAGAVESVLTVDLQPHGVALLRLTRR